MRRFEHGGNVYAHPGCLDFSANLNPLGMPQEARDMLRTHVESFACYPDPACVELVRALAAFEHVPASWVVPCAGASDAFARLCLALHPRTALVCAPCYAGYEQALEQVGATTTRLALREDEDFAVTHALVDALDEGIDLVFVANPNNPTGRCVPRDVLVALLWQAREVGAVVVVDECFVELAERVGSTDLLGRFPNLVVVKALTKSHCLAGLRVGYALSAQGELAAGLRDAGQPWAVSVPAQLAGVACLKDGGYLARSRAYVARERRRLAAALEARGFLVIAGEANFLLFKAARDLTGAFLERGIQVRSCDNMVGLDVRWHRIAVRTTEENNRFIDVLRSV